MTAPKLTPEKALIFRITHRDNLRWLLMHGLHCARSAVQDPGFVRIGNADLIGRRTEHPALPPATGVLGDYVPFYFTPYSPMMYNIKTGWGSITKRANEEIVFLVSSLPHLRELGVRFVFSDRHAYLASVRFSDSLDDLRQWIPWQLLQARDFKKDANQPEKSERYQAEALVHQMVPVNGLLGIVCYGEATETMIRALLADLGLDLKVIVRPTWYF